MGFEAFRLHARLHGASGPLVNNAFSIEAAFWREAFDPMASLSYVTLFADGYSLWEASQKAMAEHPPVALQRLSALEKLAQAEKHLANGSFADALTSIEGISEAIATDKEVATTLVKLNLEFQAKGANQTNVTETLQAHSKAARFLKTAGASTQPAATQPAKLSLPLDRRPH